MSSRIDAVLEKIQAGVGLVAVQDGVLREYARRFREEKQPRPIIAWDTDGFRWITGEENDTPAIRELGAALLFARDFRGEAVFLFDCSGVDLERLAADLRIRLKELGDRLSLNPGRTALLLIKGLLPSGLAGAVDWVGDQPKAESAAAATRTQSNVVSDIAAIVTAAEFDTDTWQGRIEKLTSEDMEEIVATKAYRRSVDRIQSVRERLKKKFAHKEKVIDAAICAAVAQVPVVLIGPPGTAKGNIIRSLCESLGLGTTAEGSTKRYFEYLLTRYTTPEEIFGPVHIQDLIERQTHRRVTSGHLPEAHVAFLDEIFKASSAILNTLLSILNERLFYNAGRPQAVPLTVVFAASNEVPSDPALSALYDRFPIRVNCAPVEDDQLPNLLRLAWEQTNDRLFVPSTKNTEQLACTNDIRLLHRVMHTRFGGRKIIDKSRDGIGRDYTAEFLRAARALRTECGISDRTLGLLFAFARAQALLAGKNQMDAEELEVFRHVKWDETGEHDRMVTNLKRSYRV